MSFSEVMWAEGVSGEAVLMVDVYACVSAEAVLMRLLGESCMSTVCVVFVWKKPTMS